jgi:hypothetical protein
VPPGFPPTESGIELKILERLSTREEAVVAEQYEPLQNVMETYLAMAKERSIV